MYRNHNKNRMHHNIMILSHSKRLLKSVILNHTNLFTQA